MSKDKKVKSLCNGKCKMSKKKGLCKGCKRSIDEIAGWGKLSGKERKKLLLLLKER